MFNIFCTCLNFPSNQENHLKFIEFCVFVIVSYTENTAMLPSAVLFCIKNVAPLNRVHN